MDPRNPEYLPSILGLRQITDFSQLRQGQLYWLWVSEGGREVSDELVEDGEEGLCDCLGLFDRIEDDFEEEDNYYRFRFSQLWKNYFYEQDYNGEPDYDTVDNYAFDVYEIPPEILHFYEDLNNELRLLYGDEHQIVLEAGNIFSRCLGATPSLIGDGVFFDLTYDFGAQNRMVQELPPPPPPPPGSPRLAPRSPTNPPPPLPPRPVGIAFEIHEAFATFIPHIPAYLRIIDQPDREYLPDIYHHIVKSFTDNIEELFEGRDKDEKIAGFRRLITKISGCIPPRYHNMIGKTMDFVFKQDDEFKKGYIIAFLEDSLKAYPLIPTGSVAGMESCTKGIMERLILSIGSVTEVLCIAGCENEKHEALYMLIKNNVTDIGETVNEIVQKWFETILPAYLEEMERKMEQNFVDFLVQEALKKGITLDQQSRFVQKYLTGATRIDFKDIKQYLGGKRRTLKRSKRSKTLMKRKTSKSSKRSKTLMKRSKKRKTSKSKKLSKRSKTRK